MEFKNIGKLPGKPSELIRLALKDLAKVERSKKYKIDMTKWHAVWPQEVTKEICCVCLAGSVIAKTLGATPDRSMTPGDFDEGMALGALDYFRRGEIHEGFIALELPLSKKIPVKIYICPYETNKKEFGKDMRYLIRLLEKEGF